VPHPALSDCTVVDSPPGMSRRVFTTEGPKYTAPSNPITALNPTMNLPPCTFIELIEHRWLALVNEGIARLSGGSCRVLLRVDYWPVTDALAASQSATSKPHCSAYLT
jgi:hypothetical protein